MEKLQLFYISSEQVKQVPPGSPIDHLIGHPVDFFVVATDSAKNYDLPLVPYEKYLELKEKLAKSVPIFARNIPSNVTPEEYFKYYCEDETAIEYFEKYKTARDSELFP